MHANVVSENEAALARIVRGMRRIAVLGIKDGRDPDQPAYSIPHMLHERFGKTIVGINPTIASALDAPTLRSLAELPADIDVLNVFRRSDAIAGITDELLALPEAQRPRVVWLQSGIRDDASAERLAAAGIEVVQDRCLGVYANRYR